MAQWKRAGPITQRSEDRNLALLCSFLSFQSRHSQTGYTCEAETVELFKENLKQQELVMGWHLKIRSLSFKWQVVDVLSGWPSGPRRQTQERSCPALNDMGVLVLFRGRGFKSHS